VVGSVAAFEDDAVVENVVAVVAVPWCTRRWAPVVAVAVVSLCSDEESVCLRPR